MKSGSAAAVLSVFISGFIFTASGSFPRAQNVTWISTNFKTLLVWGPKPSADYTYTVEFSVVGENRKRSPGCIQTTETVCDLSNVLTAVNATYQAEVLSEPPRGSTSDLVEFPHTSAERFCPYKDTDIVSPAFKLEVSGDTKITVYVTDPLTALFDGDRQLTIRDIFSNQLQYKVTYGRAKSTGKKVHFSQTSEIQLTGLDRGESYCVSVQAYIPSRSTSKQLGQLSVPQCTHDDNQSIFELYSVGVIAGAIFLILLVGAVVIAVIVFCCRRRRKAQESAKDGMPLQDV